MTGRLVAGLMLAVAAVTLLLVVPAAGRERDLARRQHQAALAERGQLRVRLASLGQRASEEERRPTAVGGAAAVRALRRAVLATTDGLAVSGVQISTSSNPRGAVVARGRLVAEGPFVDVLRLTRRLASPSSGVLLQKVSLGEFRGGVRVEAEAFILKEAS